MLITFTLATRTLKRCSTAALIASLLWPGATSKVYLPASVPRMLFSVRMGRRITSRASTVIAPDLPHHAQRLARHHQPGVKQERGGGKKGGPVQRAAPSAPSHPAGCPPP